MAPTTKSARPSTNGTNGKDIRGFFGPGVGGSSQTQPKTSQNQSQNQNQNQSQSQTKLSAKHKANGAIRARDVVEILSDDEVPRPSKATTSQNKSHKSAYFNDDDDDEPPIKAVPKRKKPIALISSSESFSEDEQPAPKKKKPSPTKPRPSAKANGTSTTAKSSTAASSTTKDSKSIAKPAAQAKVKAEPSSTASKKRKKPTALLSDDEDEFKPDEDDEEEKPKKRPKKESAPSPAKGKGKAKASDGKKDKEEAPKKKPPAWLAAKVARLSGPAPAHGSKAVPEDAHPEALAGLAFVFTGELSAFSRDEAVELAKRFGGRVTGQPSSKTDFVVLGEGAGESKLKAIQKHGVRTLDEDAFLKLIGERDPDGKGGEKGEKFRKQKEKEEAEMRRAAKEMELREKSSKVGPEMKSQLWTTRYAPQSLKEICGNKSQVEKLLNWLKEWPRSLKSNFKKPGKDAMGVFRAVLITGPPGIGKTTSAHLCAKLAGFTPVEMNASDSRSKKLVEQGLGETVGNRNLDGWVGKGKGKAKHENEFGVEITDRTCLIMDEVDGMSAGDRGGVGALNAMIKKSKIPIICIANDRQAQKLKPLQGTCFSMNFSRPQAQMVRSRIMSIAFKEKMKLPANVVDQLVTGAQSDIRQVLNMLSTWKLSANEMSFHEGKLMTKLNEKHAILSPFDITSKMLGPYLFSHTARETLGDKMELYFQDHAFVPLFIQENYLKTHPARVRNEGPGPEGEMKLLDLMDKAASSISDGDLVDGLIHGPEQHWSLMPLHSVCSAVRPASFLYGAGMHFGGQNGMSFPQWLGQNSKQNKLSRQLAEVQIRMRLKVSGDKNEIRQSYIPALHPRIVNPLIEDGSSAIDDVISCMDDYFLSKEDWDTIVELGVGDSRDEGVLKQIPGSVKTSFTRKYNMGEHPIPFYKAQELGKAPKKLASAGPAPDIEDAFEIDDETVEDVSDSEEDKKSGSSGEDLIGGSKLIKAPKTKGGAKKAKDPGGTSKGKGKAKA